MPTLPTLRITEKLDSNFKQVWHTKVDIVIIVGKRGSSQASHESENKKAFQYNTYNLLLWFLGK